LHFAKFLLAVIKFEKNAIYFLLFYPLVIKREMKRMKELFPAFFLYEKIGTPPIIIIQVIDKISNEIDVFSTAIGFWI